MRSWQLVSALVVTASILAGCTGASPTPTVTPTPTPLPNPTNDTANLAADLWVHTVLIGQVVEKVGEETLPLGGSEDSVRFGYWRVGVERYLVDVQPHREVTVRLEEMFVRPDGSLLPTRFPVGLKPGDRAVFFLTRDAGPNRPPLPEGTLTLAIRRPGVMGRWTVTDDQVNTMLEGQGRTEPLEDFVARIVLVAKEAGRTIAPACGGPPGFCQTLARASETVVLGQVVSPLPEWQEVQPSGDGRPLAVRDWEVAVERYIRSPQPVDHVTVCIAIGEV